jgi:DNA-directed RNA polymerase III subunit RPC8
LVDNLPVTCYAMFVVTTVHDTIRIPPSLLAFLPVRKALHYEIDRKYPNRVLINVGLVICRYNNMKSGSQTHKRAKTEPESSLQYSSRTSDDTNDGLCIVGHGKCVPGDGGVYYEVSFSALVWKPVEHEIITGTVLKSTSAGMQVSIGGFFQDVYIPAYYMLRPSSFDASKQLWVWEPTYDDDENEDDAKNESTDVGVSGETDITPLAAGQVKEESSQTTADAGEKQEAEDQGSSGRFEMEIGSEIRFRVKTVHFNNAQATTKSAKRETGVAVPTPPPMRVVASVCEDGLGCTRWWVSSPEDNDDEDDGTMRDS